MQKVDKIEGLLQNKQEKQEQASTVKSRSAGKTLKKWYLYDATTFHVPFMADTPELLRNSSDDDLSQAKSPEAISCISKNPENADLESQSSFPGINTILTEQQQKSSSKGRKRQFPFPQEHRPASKSSKFDNEVVKAIQDLGSK